MTATWPTTASRPTHRGARRIVLKPAQAAVYRVLLALPAGGELCGIEVAARANISKGWACEVLRALEKMGLVRHRKVAQHDGQWKTWVLWRRAR